MEVGDRVGHNYYVRNSRCRFIAEQFCALLLTSSLYTGHVRPNKIIIATDIVVRSARDYEKLYE